MPYLLFLLLVAFVQNGFAQQPPPNWEAKQIEYLNAQLQEDPSNDELVWERLKVKVGLLESFPSDEGVFHLDPEADHRKIERAHYFEALEADFVRIYEQLIKKRQTNVVEEGDFYLHRMWFYAHMMEFDRAIEDAKHLRDVASYSRFWGRGAYYQQWALRGLFQLYVVKGQYKKALQAVDQMLDQAKIKEPKIYFGASACPLNHWDKIRLFEHFKKEDQIIPMLQQTCQEHFDWYFKARKSEAKTDDAYYIGSAKERGFELLRLTLQYMKQYRHPKQAAVEEVYQAMRQVVHQNYETIDPALTDAQLQKMLAKILP